MKSAAPLFCEHRVSLRLQREATAYLSSPGTADPRLSLRVKNDALPVPVRGFEACVFKFRLPPDQALIEGTPHTPLSYGRPVLIVHEMSGLYVAVDKEPSDSFPGCCSVRLVARDTAGSACLFRVLPRYKVRSEGDIVFNGDAVHIVHQSSRLALHVSTVQHGGIIDDVLSEVNCHDETTSFELSIYDDKMQMSAEAEMFAPLRCGRAFAIYHRERESFLSLESASAGKRNQRNKNNNNNRNISTNQQQPHQNNNNNSSSSTTAIIPRFESIQNMIKDKESKNHQQQLQDILENQENSSMIGVDGDTSNNNNPTASNEQQQQQQQQSNNQNSTSNSAKHHDLTVATPITAAAQIPLDAPNSFWLIERLDPTAGGAIRANMQSKCRIRHVVTNRYLVASTNPKTRKLEVTLEHLVTEYDAEQSIFVIEHLIESASVGADSAVASSSSGQSNFQSGGSSNNDPDLVFLGRSLIVFKHVSTGMYVSSSNDANQSIALSPAASLEDAVTVINIPREYQRSVQFLLGNCEFLRAYIDIWQKYQREGAELEAFFQSPVVRRCIDHARGALISLIRHCTASIDDDPLLREGLPIPSHQQAMFEISLHKLIFDVVTSPFVSHDRVNKLELPLQGGLLQLSELNNHDETYQVCRLSYRLLKQMSKQCKLSSILVEYIDFMLSQEGYKLHIADTLGEIFTDNPDLPPKRCEQIITHFVKLLQKSRSSGYVNFLAELCVVNGRGATHNQRAVVQQLLPVADKIFLKLHDGEGAARIHGGGGMLMIDVPPEKKKEKGDKKKDKEKDGKEKEGKAKEKETTEEGGEKKKKDESGGVEPKKKEEKKEECERMPLEHFVVDKAGSKIERFFRSSIELLGALSVGNEPSALALVRRLLPVDRIFIMLNSQFPHVPALRQACLSVIRHAYFSEWLHLASLFPEPLISRGEYWTHCGSLFLKESPTTTPNQYLNVPFSSSSSSPDRGLTSAASFSNWHLGADKRATADNKRRCAEVLNIVLHYYAEAATHDFNFCIELARLLRVFAQSAKLTGAHNPNITHSTITTIVTATISILKIRVMAEGRHAKNEKTWPSIQMLHEVLITLRDFVEYALITTSQVIATETETYHQMKKSGGGNSNSTNTGNNNLGRKRTSSQPPELGSNSSTPTEGTSNNNNNTNKQKEDTKSSSTTNKSSSTKKDPFATPSNDTNNNNNSKKDNNNDAKSKDRISKKTRRANASIEVLEKEVFRSDQLFPLLTELTLYESDDLVSVALEVMNLLNCSRSFVADELKKFRVVPSEYTNAFRLLSCASQRILAAHSPSSTGLLAESQPILTDLVEVLTDIDRDFLINDTHSARAGKFKESLLTAWQDPTTVFLKPLLKNWLVTSSPLNNQNTNPNRMRKSHASAFSSTIYDSVNHFFPPVVSSWSMTNSPELGNSSFGSNGAGVASLFSNSANQMTLDPYQQQQFATFSFASTGNNYNNYNNTNNNNLMMEDEPSLLSGTNARFIAQQRDTQSLLTKDKPCNSLFALMLTLSSVVSSLVECFVTYHYAAPSSTTTTKDEKPKEGAAESSPSLTSSFASASSSQQQQHHSAGPTTSELRKSLLNFFAGASAHPFIAKELVKPHVFAEIQQLIKVRDCVGAACKTIFNVVSHFPKAASEVSVETFTIIFETTLATKNVLLAKGMELLLLGDFPIEHNQKLFLTLSEQHNLASLLSEVIYNQFLNVTSFGGAGSSSSNQPTPTLAGEGVSKKSPQLTAASNPIQHHHHKNLLPFVEVFINLIACSCVNEQSRAHVATRLIPTNLVLKILSRLRRGSLLSMSTSSAAALSRAPLLLGACKFLQTVVFGGEISKPSEFNPTAPIHSTIREWNSNSEWFVTLRGMLEYIAEWASRIPTMDPDQFLFVVQGLIPLVVVYYSRIFHPPLAAEVVAKDGGSSSKEGGAGDGHGGGLSFNNASMVSNVSRATTLAPSAKMAARSVARFFEAYADHFSCLSWSSSLSVLSLFPAEVLRMFGVQMFSYTQQLLEAQGSAQAIENLLNLTSSHSKSFGGSGVMSPETSMSPSAAHGGGGSDAMSPEASLQHHQHQHQNASVDLILTSPTANDPNNNNNTGTYKTTPRARTTSKPPEVSNDNNNYYASEVTHLASSNNNNNRNVSFATNTMFHESSSLIPGPSSSGSPVNQKNLTSMSHLSPSIQTFTSFRKSPSLNAQHQHQQQQQHFGGSGSLLSPIKLPDALQHNPLHASETPRNPNLTLPRLGSNHNNETTHFSMMRRNSSSSAGTHHKNNNKRDLLNISGNSKDKENNHNNNNNDSFGETMKLEGTSDDSSSDTDLEKSGGNVNTKKKKKSPKTNNDDDDNGDEGFERTNSLLASSNDEISILASSFSAGEPLHSLTTIIDAWSGENGKNHEPVVRLLLGMDKSVVLQTLQFDPNNNNTNQQQQENDSSSSNNQEGNKLGGTDDNHHHHDDTSDFASAPKRNASSVASGVFGRHTSGMRSVVAGFDDNSSSSNNNVLGGTSNSSSMASGHFGSAASSHFQLDPILVQRTNSTELPLMETFEVRFPFLHRVLKKIVNHMLRNDLSDAGADAALELFCALCDVAAACADTEESFTSFQTYLEGLGALRMVAEVLRHSVSTDMRRKTIKFGIATLQGGNVTVQDRLLHFFNTTDEMFFRECRRHIGLSTEVLHHHRVRVRNRNFYASAAVSVGNPLAVMGYLTLIDIVPQHEDQEESDAFTVALLRFLQLMCEGHHLGMQDYFRSQGDNFHSVNIVALVQTFFSELVLDFEPENESDSKYEVVEQVLALLIEVCQGPCSGNQQILVFNGVCKIVEKLLATDVFCEAFKSHAAQLLSIQRLCVVFLQALLEGQQDVRVPLRLIHEVPVSTFENLLRRLSDRMKQHEDIMSRRVKKNSIMMEKVKSSTTKATSPSRDAGDGGEEKKDDFDLNNKNENSSTKDPHELLAQLQEQEEKEFEEISQLITDVMYGAVIALHTTVQLIPPGTAAASAQCLDAEELLARYSSSVGRLGMIEIERNDVIERVFFRVPEVCEKLSEEAKQTLLWNIDRSSQGSKLYDLLDRTDAIIYELEVIQKLHDFWNRVNPSVAYLMNRVAIGSYDNAILANAIIINILCVFFADAAGLLDVETEWFGWEGLLRALAWAQLAMTTLAFALDSLVNVPLAVYHAQKKELLEKEKGVASGSNNNGTVGTHHKVLAKSGSTTNHHNHNNKQTVAEDDSAAAANSSSTTGKNNTSTSTTATTTDSNNNDKNNQNANENSNNSSSSSNSNSISAADNPFFTNISDYHAGRITFLTAAGRFLSNWFVGASQRFATTSRFAAVIVSIFGLYSNDLFFSIHLLGFISKSAILRNIIQAVTQNGTSLILTAALGAIMIYLFSIVGFVLFSDHFDNACATLDQCVIHILSTGLRQGGGVGDLMKSIKQGDPLYGSRVLYDTLFWAFMIVVFLNILFGIIIDTFAELRDAKSKKEEDMQTRCLICGLDAFTLDRYGDGFVAHIENEHNIWNYLYFLHHLRLKEKDDFTGQESYVDRCVTTQDISFFPNNRCTSLKKYLADQEKQKRNSSSAGGGGDDNDDDDDDEGGSENSDKPLMSSSNNNKEIHDAQFQDDEDAFFNAARGVSGGGRKGGKKGKRNGGGGGRSLDATSSSLILAAAAAAADSGDGNNFLSTMMALTATGGSSGFSLEETLQNHQHQMMAMLPDHADQLALSVMNRMQGAFFNPNGPLAQMIHRSVSIATAQQQQQQQFQNNLNNNQNQNNQNNYNNFTSDQQVQRLHQEVEKLQKLLVDADVRKIEAMQKANVSASDMRELSMANASLMSWTTQLNHSFMQYLSLKSDLFQDSICKVEKEFDENNSKKKNNKNHQPTISSSPTSTSRLLQKFFDWNTSSSSLVSDFSCQKANFAASCFTALFSSSLPSSNNNNNVMMMNKSESRTNIALHEHNNNNSQILRSSASPPVVPSTTSSTNTAADLLSSRHYSSLLPPTTTTTNPFNSNNNISTSSLNSTTTSTSRNSFWQRKSQVDLLRASDEYLKTLELQVQANNNNNNSRTASANKNNRASSAAPK